MSQENEIFGANCQTSRHGWWEFNLQTRKMRWSDALYQILNLPTGGDAALAAVRNALHPDDHERVDKLVRQALEDVVPFAFVCRILCADGEMRQMTVNAEILPDEAGKPVRVLGSAMDITEHLEIERALREVAAYRQAEEEIAVSEHFLQNIFDAIQDGISVLDENLNIVRVNRMMQEWYAHAMPLIGKKCHKVYRGLSEPCSPCPSLRAFRQGTLQKDTVPLMGPDGQIGSLQLYAFPLRDSENNIIGVVEHVRDVTDQVRAEKALRKSEQQYRALAENNQDLIMRHDREYRLLYVNQAVLRGGGGTVENYIGKTIREMGFDEDLAAMWKNAIDRVFDTGEPVREIYQWKTAENPLYFDWSVVPEFASDGSVASVLGVSRDITRIIIAEEAAASAQKLAGIGRLAAGMAHEINSPLQLVTGLSDRLHRQVEAGEIDAEQFLVDLERIQRNGRRIANITRSLLAYARQTSYNAEPRQLNKIIEETLFLMESQLKSWSNIDIRRELAEDMPDIHCDCNSITQVLINLLENARDVMPQGGTITIRTAHDPESGGFMLVISDTGPGIPEELRKKIFEPFFTTKEVGKGTGLGLSIVQGIIQSHGGEIIVESSASEGTTFTIRLPQKPPEKNGGEGDDELHGRYDVIIS